MDKIRVIFVLPKNCSSESDVSEIMQRAYEACKQTSVNVSWVEEEKLNSKNLVKTDFVVFENFSGPIFDNLKEAKCARIVGPWCLSICLLEGRPVPNFTWPIYNVAMSDCIVSCSSLSKPKKLEIKEKVNLMGGCYTDGLRTTSTHLITGSAKSQKYLEAAESGVKLMTEDWVYAVWEASQVKNIHCNDEQFLKYKCLPFHNLTICSTGLPNVDMRKKIAEKVGANGGIFTTTLTVSKTDILIVYGTTGLMSQKYKVARAHPDISCVTLEWINDSLAKGYAISPNAYRIQKQTSTPTKPNETCPDFSIISAIGDFSVLKGSVEETHLASPAPLPMPHVSNKRKCSSSEDIERFLDDFDIKKAKRTGQYLDGCEIFLAGFKPSQREKLCKILNLSGATRHDELSDRLTHIIVGDPSCMEVKIIKSKNNHASMVSMGWLFESMEKQLVADEEKFLINIFDIDQHQLTSPLSQKGLSLLRSNKTLTPHQFEKTSAPVDVQADREQDLMKQYLPSATNEEEDTIAKLLNAGSTFNTELHRHQSTEDSSYEDVTSQQSGIYFQKKFTLINFTPEDHHQLTTQIEAEGGSVMSKSFKGIPDYLVLPMFISVSPTTSALQVVSCLWIVECVKVGDLVDIEDYHKPLLVKNVRPLTSCVVTCSGYSVHEKIFLKGLIEELGGICQEKFARIASREMNILSSTHLVSLEANGKKYDAALKWGIPVMKKEWLFKCADKGEYVAEAAFLVGDSKVSVQRKSESKATLPSTNVEKRVLTPLNQRQPLNISRHDSSQHTPINQKLLKGVAPTPDACSQVTPINKLMEEVRKTNLLGTPETPPMAKTWYDVDTPESPFGACIKPNLSPKSKKELMRYINRLPDFKPLSPEPKSTPFSEVKRKLWKKLLGEKDSPASPSVFRERTDPSRSQRQEDEQPQETTLVENLFIDSRLKQIQEMSNAIGDQRRCSKGFESTVQREVIPSHSKDSQPLTVGWDYNEEASQSKDKNRIFIISGIENDTRESLVEKIERLGATVSDLATYDPRCTHLICIKPARNEKTLSCMAAGKWILHISYVERSIEAGHFVDEEEYEFGNPLSKGNIKPSDEETEIRSQSMHWWRKEITRRGYGAFNDMRAIVVAQKRESITRVIEAGGGQIVNAVPPFDESVHATHCLLEMKSVSDFNLYAPLARQGILCINTLYISDFLYRNSKDIKDAILPHFSRFYT